VNDGRTADYLDDLTELALLAALDCASYAPSFDEWNALRAAAGQPAGTWREYLESFEVES